MASQTDPYPVRVTTPVDGQNSGPLASPRTISGIPGGSIPSSPTPISPVRRK